MLQRTASYSCGGVDSFQLGSAAARFSAVRCRKSLQLIPVLTRLSRLSVDSGVGFESMCSVIKERIPRLHEVGLSVGRVGSSPSHPIERGYWRPRPMANQVSLANGRKTNDRAVLCKMHGYVEGRKFCMPISSFPRILPSASALSLVAGPSVCRCGSMQMAYHSSG